MDFSPDAWAWSGRQYATDGRFQGRWADIDGNFRIIYAGSRLLACLLEVLAHFRQDAYLPTALGPTRRRATARTASTATDAVST
ncbi:RES domain-containing protein [Arthrobacter agilis]|uniref:RES domain-containing protein n=1 Tax=Arthrobacter agilis TaxID=37921 RepID=UPI001ABEEE03